MQHQCGKDQSRDRVNIAENSHCMGRQPVHTAEIHGIGNTRVDQPDVITTAWPGKSDGILSPVKIKYGISAAAEAASWIVVFS